MKRKNVIICHSTEEMNRRADALMEQGHQVERAAFSWEYLGHQPCAFGLLPSWRCWMEINGVYPVISGITESAKEKWPKAYKFVCIAILLIFVADVAARLFLGSNYVGP